MLADDFDNDEEDDDHVASSSTAAAAPQEGGGGGGGGGEESTKPTYSLPRPPRAAQLSASATPGAGNKQKQLYWDRSHYDSPASQLRALKQSATLYVGNLAFSTRSNHVYAHFSQLGGTVLQIHMGLDRLKKTPCGFCFVEYRHRQDALNAVALLSGTKLDGMTIRVELDAGFQPGRQYGRGRGGGQVRDDKTATRRMSSGGMKRPRPPPPPLGPPPPAAAASKQTLLQHGLSTPRSNAEGDAAAAGGDNNNQGGGDDDDDDDEVDEEAARASKRLKTE